MYHLGESEYPKEALFELKNNPHHMGRITVVKLKEEFSAEIDIILKESHKIFHHVETLYNYEEERDVYNTAMQKLLDFLSNKQQEISE
jgi:hypothetical protein